MDVCYKPWVAKVTGILEYAFVCVMLFLPSAKVTVMSLIQTDIIQWGEELVVIEMGFWDNHSKSRLCTRVSLSHHCLQDQQFP